MSNQFSLFRPSQQYDLYTAVTYTKINKQLLWSARFCFVDFRLFCIECLIFLQAKSFIIQVDHFPCLRFRKQASPFTINQFSLRCVTLWAVRIKFVRLTRTCCLVRVDNVPLQHWTYDTSIIFHWTTWTTWNKLPLDVCNSQFNVWLSILNFNSKSICHSVLYWHETWYPNTISYNKTQDLTSAPQWNTRRKCKKNRFFFLRNHDWISQK